MPESCETCRSAENVVVTGDALKMLDRVGDELQETVLQIAESAARSRIAQSELKTNAIAIGVEDVKAAGSRLVQIIRDQIPLASMAASYRELALLAVNALKGADTPAHVTLGAQIESELQFVDLLK